MTSPLAIPANNDGDAVSHLTIQISASLKPNNADLNNTLLWKRSRTAFQTAYVMTKLSLNAGVRSLKQGANYYSYYSSCNCLLSNMDGSYMLLSRVVPGPRDYCDWSPRHREHHPANHTDPVPPLPTLLVVQWHEHPFWYISRDLCKESGCFHGTVI